jgi:very-short-patch-repair endonuclease
LARAQHWVVTRRQLLALGFDSRSIEHRLKTGRLHRVHAGVYAVGRRQLTRYGRWMAAVLACGDGAVLSHRSAAALWGIGTEGKRVDVTATNEKRRPRIRTATRPGLGHPRTTVHEGIPVTTPIQTLVDIALELSMSGLERAVNDADKENLVDPETLRTTLDAEFVGEPGVKPLRILLDRDTFRMSDEELERRFRPIAEAAGLPVPETKVIVNAFEVDFYWPDLGLVIETDGLRYHRTPAAQARDARRDQAHTAAGLARLRFTHWQVRFEPAYVRRILTRTRAHLVARPQARAAAA